MKPEIELVYEFHHRDAPKIGASINLFLDDNKSPLGTVTRKTEGADHVGLDAHVTFNRGAVERYLARNPERKLLER